MNKSIVVRNAPRTVIAPHTEKADKERSDPNTQRIVKSQLNHRDVEPAARKGHGTVGLMVINERRLNIEERITAQAPEHTGSHTAKHSRQIGHTETHTVACADSGEKAQTDSITPNKHVIGQVLFIETENHRSENGNQKHQPHQLLIGNPIHRTAVNQKVTNNPAAKSRGKSQHENTDRVTFHSDADQHTGKGKSHDADDVSEIQKVNLVVKGKQSRRDIHS